MNSWRVDRWLYGRVVNSWTGGWVKGCTGG